MVTTKKNTVVIEPSPVVRYGVRRMLEESAEFSVVGVYSDIKQFKDDFRVAFPDVIILNPAVVSVYKSFSVRELFPNYSDSTIFALVYGYVVCETKHSFDGVVDIYDEGDVIVKKILATVNDVDNVQSSNATDSVDLSEREKEILVAVAKGMTNKEIADKFFLSVHTVISHRKNITRKTGIKTVSGLTMYAIFNNLIPHDSMPV